MNLKFTILVFSLKVLTLNAHAQNSTLSGYIFSFEGQPLIGVSVSLQNTDHSAITNENGYFILRRLPVGTYTLAASTMGYSAIKQNVVVVLQNPAPFELRHSEDHRQLAQVTIRAISGHYKTDHSSVATRTDAQMLL